MSNLQAFFAQNAIKVETVKEVISTRFLDDKGKPIPFEIRALSNEEDSEIRKSCQRKVKQKKGVYQTETDQELYLAKFAAACVVFPNLKDAELQKSYGVLGEEQLIKKMLTPGEFAELLQVAQAVNGYDKDMNDLVEDAKN